MDMKVTECYLQRAKWLHSHYPVVDAHLDLAGEILLRKQAGEEAVIRRLYLENWKKAGIRLIVSSVYVPNSVLQTGGTEGAFENARQQIEALEEEMRDLPELMPVLTARDLPTAKDLPMAKDLPTAKELPTAKDLPTAKELPTAKDLSTAENSQATEKKGKIGILLYMEGLDCIGTRLDRIDELYEKGVRGASLTWSRANALAVGCCKAGEYRQIRGGLTELGKEAVRRLEQRSLFLDVSHLNDDGFADVAALAEKPFIATHSCARRVYDNYRNLTDEQMLALSAKGGVMGLNGCRLIAGSRLGNHLEMLCRHAEYEVARMGASHVGFGFDLCDSYQQAERAKGSETGKASGMCKTPGTFGASFTPDDCLADHSQIPLLTAALLQRGMKEETVIRIMGENFLTYFKKVLPA